MILVQIDTNGFLMILERRKNYEKVDLDFFDCKSIESLADFSPACDDILTASAAGRLKPFPNSQILNLEKKKTHYKNGLAPTPHTLLA